MHISGGHLLGFGYFRGKQTPKDFHKKFDYDGLHTIEIPFTRMDIVSEEEQNNNVKNKETGHGK